MVKNNKRIIHKKILLSVKSLFYCLLALVVLSANLPVYAATGEESAVEGKEGTAIPSVIVSDYEELAQAIDKANDGDVIGFDKIISIYNDVEFLGDTDKTITILKMANDAYIEVGQSQKLTVRNLICDGNIDTINEENRSPFFSINSNTAFEDVTIQNNYSTDRAGAIVINTGVATLVDCTLRNNYAKWGGGHIMLKNTAIANIQNCVLINGEAWDGGAIYNFSETAIVNLDRTIVKDNVAKDVGGGVFNKGKMFVRRSMIYDNVAICGADLANGYSSKFQMESIDKLVDVYRSIHILPIEWETDFDQETMMAPSDFNTMRDFALVKLNYEIIPESEYMDSNTENVDSEETQPQGENDIKPKQSEEEKGVSDNGTAADSSLNAESGTNSTDSTESQSEDNPQNEEDSSRLDNQSSNISNVNLEDSKENKGSALDSSSGKSNVDDKITNNSNDVTDNSTNKEDCDKNNNTTTATSNAIEHNEPNAEISQNANTGSKNTVNDSQDVKNNSQKDNESTTPSDSSSTQLSDTKNNTSTKENTDSSSNVNDGTKANTDTTAEKSNNAIEPTKNDGDSAVGKDDKSEILSANADNIGTIKDESTEKANTAIASNAVKKPVVKKVIKKCKVTAKKGKKNVSGKTIAKATVKIKIGKKTYKVKSNAKGKFTVKLKGKAKLKKGQKIKVTITKKGYKAKNKVFKVK